MSVRILFLTFSVLYKIDIHNDINFGIFKYLNMLVLAIAIWKRNNDYVNH